MMTRKCSERLCLVTAGHWRPMLAVVVYSVEESRHDDICRAQLPSCCPDTADTPQPLHLHRDTLHANWNMTLGDGLSF